MKVENKEIIENLPVFLFCFLLSLNNNNLKKERKKYSLSFLYNKSKF